MAARARRPERGQAVMVAVIGLIVLAIGMYTSYNLSRTVYEKIKLQNAADAAAYSLATLEARTFNFIAFANRAQVANYVQMLELQSLLSNWSQMEGMTGFLGDWALSMAENLDRLGDLPGMEWLKPLAAILAAVGSELAATNMGLMEVVNVLDEAVKFKIKVASTKNRYIFAASALLLLTTEMQLLNGGWDIVLANDPGTRRSVMSHLVSALNAASFTTAFDPSMLRGLGVHVGSAEEEKRAQRVVTELVHATRFNDLDDEAFIVARGPFSGITALMGNLTSILGQIASNDFGRYGGWLRPITDVLNLVSGANGPGGPGHYIGTAKLLTAEEGGYGDLDDTGGATPEHSDLARGVSIVARDRFESPLFRLPDEFFSVRSGTDTSQHCRYVRPEGYGRGGWRAFRMLYYPEHYGFDRRRNCKSEADDDHRWRSIFFAGGLAPFLNFKAQKDGWQAEKTSFNQPDVWMFLNKPPASMALGGTGDLDFDLKQGGRTAQLDARIGEGGIFRSGFGEGINVIARAQVYYHRPGAWQEPPNLFNPFWGARLAPKSVAIARLTQELGLSNETVENLIQDNVWMH